VRSALHIEIHLLTLCFVFVLVAEILILGMNSLVGTIPESIGLVTNLGTSICSLLYRCENAKDVELIPLYRLRPTVELIVQENQHTGTLPLSLFDLTTLGKEIQLSFGVSIHVRF
jgi:hypothetical protein